MQKNICIKCQRETHSGHKYIDLGEIFPFEKEIEEAKKLFEIKKEKLTKLKDNISDWLKEFNKKINELIDSIDAEIEINKNILKTFKTDMWNYQMVQNFNYFSSKKTGDKYSSLELINFANEEVWNSKLYLIAAFLGKKEQKKKINKPIDNNKIKTNLKQTVNVENSKKPIFDNSLIYKIESKDKNYYWNLNEANSMEVSNKLFKSNLDIKEKVYSGLIDNKGIIFFGSDSSLLIYRFDFKTNKIEKEFVIKGLDGSVNTIIELREDYLLVGTGNNTIKIIQFYSGGKYQIHQEIRNKKKDSIYKVIELSNYSLVSCSEKNITFFAALKNNYYELKQEINMKTPTYCILEIDKCIIAANQPKLKKISFYQCKNSKLEFKKEIEDIESEENNNNIMAIMNEEYFCSISSKTIYIISSKKFELVKKVESKMESNCLFPISYGMILFCHNKQNDKNKLDYYLSLKTFDEKNRDLIEIEEKLVSKNKEKKEQVFFLNFFDPNIMLISTVNNITHWE